MPEASAGQDLGIGDDRCHQSLSTRIVADGRVGDIMEGVLAIEKADYDIGVEDYRHSLRSPSTRSRKSPPVSRHPE